MTFESFSVMIEDMKPLAMCLMGLILCTNKAIWSSMFNRINKCISQTRCFKYYYFLFWGGCESSHA